MSDDALAQAIARTKTVLDVFDAAVPGLGRVYHCMVVLLYGRSVDEEIFGTLIQRLGETMSLRDTRAFILAHLTKEVVDKGASLLPTMPFDVKASYDVLVASVRTLN